MVKNIKDLTGNVREEFAILIANLRWKKGLEVEEGVYNCRTIYLYANANHCALGRHVDKSVRKFTSDFLNRIPSNEFCREHQVKRAQNLN